MSKNNRKKKNNNNIKNKNTNYNKSNTKNIDTKDVEGTIENISDENFNDKISEESATSIEPNNESNKNADNKPMLQDFTGNANDVFSTNKQKYENTMSSAVILLTFGIIGLFIEFLAVVGVIYLPVLTFQYVLMFIVFAFFLMSGVFSYRKANSYKAGMNEEDEQRNKVDYFLNDLLTDQVLKELKSEELSDEENYVLIVEKLSTMILEKYPEYNKDLLEYMIDDYLNEHF